MATTFEELLQSVRALVGNRTDIDETIGIAINDALRVTAGLHPEPTHLTVVDILTDDESTEVVSDDQTPVQLLETVTAASIYTGGDYAAIPRPDGHFEPLEKGNPTIFLTPPMVTRRPTHWAVLGGLGAAPVLWLSAPPDKAYTVRLLGYKMFPKIAGGDTAYVPDILIPSVRVLAVSLVKVMLGQIEDAAALTSWAKAFAKGIDTQARSEDHGHTGFKVQR